MLVASGTNALNLLYSHFMRSLIPFQDIAFICLPYHHYFSREWCSHEISSPFWQLHLPLLLLHSPPHITCSLGHLWSLQESSCLSSDHPLSVTEHIGLLILPCAILGKKKEKRYGNDSQSEWDRERAYITLLSIHFFLLVVTCHFSASHPRPQHIKHMIQFSSVGFDLGCSVSVSFSCVVCDHN